MPTALTVRQMANNEYDGVGSRISRWRDLAGELPAPERKPEAAGLELDPVL